jgi:hypothetical protein
MMCKMKPKDSGGFMTLGGKVVGAHCVKLVVPSDSALGIALNKDLRKASRAIAKEKTSLKEGRKQRAKAAFAARRSRMDLAKTKGQRDASK